MTIHRPTADELLEALQEYLSGDLAARVSGADAFHLRVAGNVLAIVRREMARGTLMQEQAAARFAGLTGRSGDLPELTSQLCNAIRSGTIAPDDPVLLDVLREVAADRLAVDNPRYATYRRVRNPNA